MNFFEHQAKARRNTGRLVALLVLTVLLISAACYFVGLAAVSWFDLRASYDTGGLGTLDQHGGSRFSWWRLDVLGYTVIAVLAVIAVGSLWKIRSLRGGGDVVAAGLGGRMVSPETEDPNERRLLNVVEEMALASGIAVPSVFVMDDEKGINAFAAGFSPNDAVIAATRGCVQALSRDELQGVIAHEFSHILNGDMRLNIRLIGLTHGILFLGFIGKGLVRAGLESSRVRVGRRSGGAALIGIVFGGLLAIIGYIGVFFGRLIKAAVSRQREFLADASAVSFTRNPSGLAGALKKIGGHPRKATLLAPAAEEASHMFFANGLLKPLFLENALATHPPLADRIRRIDPSFDGEFPRVEPAKAVPMPPNGKPDLLASRDTLHEMRFTRRTAGSAFQAMDNVMVAPDQVVSQVAAPTIDHLAYGAALIASLPAPVRAAAYKPFGAVALIYALLLDTDDAERQRQLDLLHMHSEPTIVQKAADIWPMVSSLHLGVRLPLADLTVPALRQLSQKQYTVFRKNVRHLVTADRMVSIFEFALLKLLLRRLAAHFGSPDRKEVRYRAFSPLLPDCLTVLSFLTRIGHRDAEATQKAFDAAVSKLPKTAARAESPSILPEKPGSFRALGLAIDRLAMASPRIKERIVDACARCVLADGTVTVKEAELLRAVTDALDCPLPPFLPSVGTTRDSKAG
ncbi:MAG: M48 family metallopeptidase [Phycisphaerae bacterium]|nr:M48 family metallopeptidase [Phycisphaerae bacterium]